jgi:hypothetical protein
LSLEAPDKNAAKRTLDALRFVQSFPNFLVPALVEHFEQWLETGDSGEDRMTYAWIDAGVLCDATTPLTDLRERSRCLPEANIDQFIVVLGKYA